MKRPEASGEVVYLTQLYTPGTPRDQRRASGRGEPSRDDASRATKTNLRDPDRSDAVPHHTCGGPKTYDKIV